MKCIPLVWDGGTHQTFVLGKRELMALLDVPNRNPRSQWFGVSFQRQALYTCDGHRALVVQTGYAAAANMEVDEHYIPVAAIKAMAKGAKMTTAFLLSDGPNGYRLGVAEMESKTWNLFPDEVVTDKAETVHVTQVPRQEVGAAVPRICALESRIDQLRLWAASEEKAHPVLSFRPEYLATFGKLDQMTKPNPAKLTLGQGPLDAAMFEVESTDGETEWIYVLMPMKKTNG